MSSGRHAEYRHSCSVLLELEFFSKSFGKILKYKISWKSVKWEPSSMTDRHDKSKSLFSQFWERAKNRRNLPVKRVCIIVCS